ncbi:hypothetical protein Nepgr_025858 [Nepenthes gracilis]|uniref:Uncharacterized protein n=1 Tax=Nepenthes gracilis TaxID=150966 RepID=A0AAD3Y1I3_NEPGR|nr:hypothetical protein Nepgr_025858 [Nepenthes gracilis]
MKSDLPFILPCRLSCIVNSVFCRPVVGCCRSLRALGGRQAVWSSSVVCYGLVLWSDLPFPEFCGELTLSLSNRQCAVKSCKKLFASVKSGCCCGVGGNYFRDSVSAVIAVNGVDDVVSELGWLMVFSDAKQIQDTSTLNFSSAVLFFLSADRWYHI